MKWGASFVEIVLTPIAQEQKVSSVQWFWAAGKHCQHVSPAQRRCRKYALSGFFDEIVDLPESQKDFYGLTESVVVEWRGYRKTAINMIGGSRKNLVLAIQISQKAWLHYKN